MRYPLKIIFRILFSSLGLCLRFLWVVPAGFIAYKFARKCKNLKSLSDDEKDRIPLFFWSQVIWWEVWQRPQEFCSNLCCERPVIFFSPVQIHRRFDSLNKWKHRVELETGRGLSIISPLIFPGEYKSKLAATVNKMLLTGEIRLLLYKCPNFIFMSNSPFVGALPRILNPSLTVYDVIDDFIAFSWAPEGSEKLEKALFECSDLTFTGTSTLLDKKRKFHKDMTFVQCGVKFDMFNKPSTSAPPDDIKSLKKPVIGYIGSLSDRTDSELLDMLSKKYKDASLVLIGPIHGSFGKPPKSESIHYLGLKPHESLPLYLKAFDVCLMPFRLTEAALAINPVKTLEYLAAGKPVVSTAIPDVIKFYSDVVAIANSREHFIELVGEMIYKDQSDRVKKGVQRAQNSTWQKMTEQMNLMINDRISKKAKMR